MSLVSLAFKKKFIAKHKFKSSNIIRRFSAQFVEKNRR